MNETVERTLPEGFTGVFYFTNPTSADFEGYWNSVKYVFPANKTVPLIIPSETPLGVQEIRKKFARELATLMFYDSEKYKIREAEAPAGTGKIPALFTEADIAPYVQRCIEPMPMAEATVSVVELDQTEKKMKTDAKGHRRTKVLDGDENLTAGGVVA